MFLVREAEQVDHAKGAEGPQNCGPGRRVSPGIPSGAFGNKLFVSGPRFDIGKRLEG